MYIELQNPRGTNLVTGFTPITFSATSKQQYIVYANNYQNLVFSHWDDGTTNQSRLITPTHDTVLTAYYSIDTNQSTHDDNGKYYLDKKKQHGNQDNQYLVPQYN
jgi:hypothetical protein